MGQVEQKDELKVSATDVFATYICELCAAPQSEEELYYCQICEIEDDGKSAKILCNCCGIMYHKRKKHKWTDKLKNADRLSHKVTEIEKQKKVWYYYTSILHVMLL